MAGNRKRGAERCSFMRRLTSVLVAVFLTSSKVCFGLTPNAPIAGLREGANHHLGDVGLQHATNDEKERMHAHLTYVRALLGGRPATRPELATQRQSTLGFLDEYIAKGSTPQNLHLPWRTPVFIDDDGTVCAVGYLIERSGGKALAETIAKEHRYDLLEDIAAEMPEVRAWVADSGFTLEELASIQPGYSSAMQANWVVPNWGSMTNNEAQTNVTGTLVGSLMQGAWTRTDAENKAVGSGTLVDGGGKWTSVYEDGKALAEGSLMNNLPQGAWRFYHPSGNLAGQGSFDKGLRSGAWSFFYDSKTRVPIAEGGFTAGEVTGHWRHYDDKGALLATSDSVTPVSWRYSFGGHLLDVRPGADGVHHWIHQGNIAGDFHRLDLFHDGSEPIYVRASRDGATYDSNGNKLEKVNSVWTATSCHWSHARLASARAGDVVTLDGYFFKDGWQDKPCDGAPQPIGASRSRHLEAMLASERVVRAQSADFVRRLALGETTLEDADDASRLERSDLAKVLAGSMTWYIEFPHVDGLFLALAKTLPGYP